MPLINLTYFSIYRISESPARSRWAAGRYKNGFITQYGLIRLLTCHTPFPDPTRMADPNRVRGARLSIGTLIDWFFLIADTCTYFLIHMHNFCNNKNHLHIYKRTTTGVVSIKIYTHILSPIYLDTFFFFNTTH